MYALDVAADATVLSDAKASTVIVTSAETAAA